MNAPKMLRLALAAAVAGLFLAHAPGAVAQDPPQDLDVPTGIMEITLPSDGVLRYGSVILRANADVRFIRNLANTPVYILATGTITTEAGSVIHADARRPPGRLPAAAARVDSAGATRAFIQPGRARGPVAARADA